MRELKFRAWIRKGKKMVGVKMLTERYLWTDDVWIDEQTSLTDTCDEIGLTCELMQFTGLLDKNKKPIYEGDCLGGLHGSLAVKWCDECRGWSLYYPYYPHDKECYGCMGEVHWLDMDLKELEVIGNIYENPDLLK